MAIEQCIQFINGKEVGGAAFPASADRVSYGNGTVKDALDELSAEITVNDISLDAYASSDTSLLIGQASKTGNTVTISGRFAFSSYLTGNSHTIATLPLQLRPSATKQSGAIVNIQTDGLALSTVMIVADGRLFINTGALINGGIFNITYTV